MILCGAAKLPVRPRDCFDADTTSDLQGKADKHTHKPWRVQGMATAWILQVGVCTHRKLDFSVLGERPRPFRSIDPVCRRTAPR